MEQSKLGILNHLDHFGWKGGKKCEITKVQHSESFEPFQRETMEKSANQSKVLVGKDEKSAKQLKFGILNKMQECR